MLHLENKYKRLYVADCARARYKESGIALILSLLISFIIAFALAVELLTIRLNEKNAGLRREQDQLFYTVEKKGNAWINSPDFYSACLLPVNNSGDAGNACNPNDYPEALIQKTIAGCVQQEKNITLNAVTEDLGLMPCLKIETDLNKRQNTTSNPEQPEKIQQDAHFYRMSVLGENTHGYMLIIQMVYAVPEINVNSDDACPSKVFKTISAGRQSWRLYS